MILETEAVSDGRIPLPCVFDWGCKARETPKLECFSTVLV